MVYTRYVVTMEANEGRHLWCWRYDQTFFFWWWVVPGCVQSGCYLLGGHVVGGTKWTVCVLCVQDGNTELVAEASVDVRPLPSLSGPTRTRQLPYTQHRWSVIYSLYFIVEWLSLVVKQPTDWEELRENVRYWLNYTMLLMSKFAFFVFCDFPR